VKHLNTLALTVQELHLVMEYVDGGTLADAIDRCRGPPY
jgi:hypothetical protein